MIISLKDHFAKLFKASRAPLRFTILQNGIIAKPKITKMLTFDIPTSRFSGVNVKVLGLSPDDELYVRMFGMVHPAPLEPTQKQFESKFTGADNEDNFQGWIYRDFTNRRKLYVQLYSTSALDVTVNLEIIGETL